MGLSSVGCSVALIGLREKLFSQEDNNYFFFCFEKSSRLHRLSFHPSPTSSDFYFKKK